MSGFLSAGIVGGSDIPDSGLQHEYDAIKQGISDAATVDPLSDQRGSKDLSAVDTPVGETNGINGNDSINYDGSNDSHTDSTAISLGTGDEYTIAIVLQLQTIGATEYTFTNGDPSTGGFGLIADDGNNEWQYNHHQIAVNTISGVDTDPHVFVASYDGSTLIVDLDKTEEINTSINIDSPSSVFATASDGSGNEADMFLGGFAYYDVFKNNTERDEIADYFGNRYGIF